MTALRALILCLLGILGLNRSNGELRTAQWRFCINVYPLGLAVNQPYFCPNTTWNPNATTFANSSVISVNISGIFVTTKNTVYLPSQTQKQILIWIDGNNTVSTSISFNRSSLAGLFVTVNDDLYIHVGKPTGWIEQYSMNITNPVRIMNVTGICFGLFITDNGTLYCSYGASDHRVMRTTLANPLSTATVAGNGTLGSSSIHLNTPYGVFIDDNFRLYVADFGNNRVQLFLPGQSNATTVAGAGAAGTFNLSRPNFLALDGNGYLYILDNNNNRLVGQGPTGFQCVIGCSGSAGSGAHQLSSPANFAFDPYGNILISDMGNSRIQNFTLATNTCGKDCLYVAASAYRNNPSFSNVFDKTYSQSFTPHQI